MVVTKYAYVLFYRLKDWHSKNVDAYESEEGLDLVKLAIRPNMERIYSLLGVNRDALDKEPEMEKLVKEGDK